MADTRTFGHSNNRSLGENIFFGQRSGEPMTGNYARIVINEIFTSEIYDWNRLVVDATTSVVS